MQQAQGSAHPWPKQRGEHLTMSGSLMLCLLSNSTLGRWLGEGPVGRGSVEGGQENARGGSNSPCRGRRHFLA